MNRPSEQLSADKSLHTALDQPLAPKDILSCLQQCLGGDCCVQTQIDNKKAIKYTCNNKTFILLTKAVTYLGNPHPVFKKRIQLPDWYQYFAQKHSDLDIRFIKINFKTYKKTSI